MPVPTMGAQRASRQRSLRLTVVMILAAAFAVSGIAVQPATVQAGGRKVVIVVGPAGSATSKYINTARGLAAQARSYGATVYEVYSPNATWAKVRSVAQGASVFIYLGHGNGYPSSYSAFSKYSKDGLGLNTTAGSTRHTYYGEYYVARDLNFAPGAVVILNHLCYASGNNEWGAGTPTKSTAIKRVDNYGAGFLRANARAVFAEGIDSASYILAGLFQTNQSISDIFWSDPAHDGRYDFSFASVRTSGRRAIMDPLGPNRYYRSVIGDLSMSAVTFRAAGAP